MRPNPQRPTNAFIGASWVALAAGGLAYCLGLWNSPMPLYEKGFYLIILLFGLFGAVSLQKSVRDRIEGIPVTSIYFGLCWVAVGCSFVLITIGLWNAELDLSSKGFYAMSFMLSMFGAVAVQKNVRDLALIDGESLFGAQELRNEGEHQLY
ncbi:MAG: inner membrane protein YiaA [Roseiflexaceae bacterium]